MAKLSKQERAEVAKNLALCEAAVATFKKMLADDDEASKAAGARSDTETIKSIASRDGAGAAILAIRAGGGNRIADQVHGRGKE